MRSKVIVVLLLHTISHYFDVLGEEFGAKVVRRNNFRAFLGHTDDGYVKEGTEILQLAARWP